MSTFEPTLFTLETNTPLNDEQIAAQLAYHELTSFNVFDNRMFYNIHEFATNHLLTWCSEVLTAYRLGCFEDGDQSHEHAKRMLIYRFKQFFVHSRNTAYNEVVPFSIDWNDYIVLNNTPVKAQNEVGKSCFIHDVDAFLANVPIFRAEWSVNATHDELQVDNYKDVKIGEDVGTIPTIIEDTPSLVKAIIHDPVNAIFPKRKYLGRKVKYAQHYSQRVHKAVQNARKVKAFKYPLVKGYNQMPHDSARQLPNSDQFAPTIFLDDMYASRRFDQEFPPAERQHGFMVSCKGINLYWNTLTQDFGTELVALP